MSSYNYKGKKNISFHRKYKIKKILKDNTIKKKQFAQLDEIKSYLNKFDKGNFVIDKNSCSLFYENLIKKKFKILKKNDPIYALKAIKNTSEIKHMVNAHYEDGLALTKFIYWIKHKKKN